MTDKLTPGMLRDFGSIISAHINSGRDWGEVFCEEAARREVKQPAAPASADDLVERLRDENPTFLLNEQAADRIEAQEWKIAALEDARDIHIAQAKRAETENARLRDAGNLLYKALVDNDEEGLVEAAEPMRAWRTLTNGGDR